jgi:hypothetical protein
LIKTYPVVLAFTFLILFVAGAGINAQTPPTATVTAAQTSPEFFGMSMTAGVTLLEPWPNGANGCCNVQFGGVRLWDSGVPWYVLNPSSGVYNWTTLDAWISLGQQNGTDILYTFGELPSWASSNPTDPYCSGYPQDPGSCDPPSDVNPDGSGTDQHWKDFVTAIVTHAAGRIHYWETWNEASNAGRQGVKGVGQWKGTNAQMLRMAKDAHHIIRSLDPSAIILSPSTKILDNVWLTEYLAARGGEFADALAFHGYVYEGSTPVPETLIPLLQAYRKVLKKYHQESKPVFDTEASWGITENTGPTDPDEQAGFVSRFYLLHRKAGVQRYYWYEWDGTAGTLWSPADVAVANGGSANNTVSVLSGIGNGSFFTPAPYTVGSNLTALTVGDFNNDGLTDIAATNAGGNGSDNVSLLLGNGDGTFQNAVSYAVGNSPTAVTVGDFNGDGNADLAVTNGADNTVTILLGNGDGTFQVAATYATGYTPASVVAGDFNGDGNLDLAVANSCGSDPTCQHNGTISVFLSNGNGTFQPAVSHAAGKDPLSVAVGDFDGDGNLDLAVANKLDNTVSILWGNGDGTFQDTGLTLTTDSGPDSVIVGDFNGDGQPDLAVANRGTNDVSVFLNSSGRTFQTATNYNVGGQPYSLTAVDLTGNGALDLITANYASNNVTVLFGNGDGTFQQKVVTSHAGSSPVSIAAGNFKVYGPSYVGTLRKAGCAYRTTYNWMVGRTMDVKACRGPIPPQTGVWSCNLSGPSGYQAQAVWDTSQSCKDGVCTFSNYSFDPKYTDYVTVYGQISSTNGSTVPIGYLPILLENQKSSVPSCHTD